MPLWDNIKSKAAQVGKATSIAAQKAKIKADLLLIDREIKSQKQMFGIDLYNCIEEQENKTQGGEQAYWDNFKDETMKTQFKKPYEEAKLEIHEHVFKINSKMQQLNHIEETRTKEFGNPDDPDDVASHQAKNMKEKVKNASKSAGMMASEGKLRSSMSMINKKIEQRKQEYGLHMYTLLVDLEDSKNWLPADRDVRSLYDRARQEILKVEEKKRSKYMDLLALGGQGASEIQNHNHTDADGKTAESAPATNNNETITSETTTPETKEDNPIQKEDPTKARTDII